MLNRRELLKVTAAGLAVAASGVGVAAAAPNVIAKPPALGLVGRGMSDFGDVIQGIIRVRDVDRIYLTPAEFTKYVYGDGLARFEKGLLRGNIEEIWPGAASETLSKILIEKKLWVNKFDKSEDDGMSRNEEAWRDREAWSLEAHATMMGRSRRPD